MLSDTFQKGRQPKRHKIPEMQQYHIYSISKRINMSVSASKAARPEDAGKKTTKPIERKRHKQPVNK